MYTKLITPPATEPITLDETKEFLNMLGITDDDALITTFMESARGYAEKYTNRQLVTATYELYSSEFIQDLTMPKNPIQSISSIEYMDETGSYVPLSTDDYYLYGSDDIFKIYFDTLPSHKKHKEAVKITFIAGYGDATDVPTTIKTFLKILVSNMYENRDLYVTGVSIETMANPIAMQMISFYRVQPI